MAGAEPVPLNDLKRHNLSVRKDLSAAVQRVLNSGWYVLGPEVEAFENEFASYCGVAHCVSVANGTDALEIALRMLGVGRGDDVITVANAGMYSVTAIRAAGATPVFAEIDISTMNMDSASLVSTITPRTKAVIVTHLYGRLADMSEIVSAARQHRIAVIEDCAQAHGASLKGRRAGRWGDVGCFSFYPTKNLGALGDGGAVVTSDESLAIRARYLRQYGWTSKYHSEMEGGRNSRLDEVQAAVLRVKLAHLDEWNALRSAVARRYDLGLANVDLNLPLTPTGDEMVYHLYVVRSSEREQLRTALKAQGIGCAVHYPTPTYLQPSCADLGYARGYLPVTEKVTSEVLSIPCFAELSGSELDRVVKSVQVALG